MGPDLYKTPRLYVDAPLEKGAVCPLEAGQAHYLLNVMRLEDGAILRVFNGKDGEFAAKIEKTGKKQAHLRVESLIRAQDAPERRVVLYLSPLKKEKTAFLIEKSVELGVAALCPVVTENTQMAAYREEKIRSYIIEAAEQCERLDLPNLAAPAALADVLAERGPDAPLLACVERAEGAVPLAEALRAVDETADVLLFIGPEGGFTAQEKDRLADHPAVRPVSLGPRILRAETAALAALSLALLGR